MNPEGISNEVEWIQLMQNKMQALVNNSRFCTMNGI
jgi:hypothetical protein